MTLQDQFAKLWHPTRNGDLKLTEVSLGSRRKLWWRCEQGHEWQAMAYSIKAGTSCPYCFGRCAIPGETDLAATHPHMLRFWSPRNGVDPGRISAGSHKKVWWRCEQGHEWESAVVSVVTDGNGCPYCAGRKAIPGETDLATLRPDLMAQWDVQRNTLDPGEVTVSSHEQAWWLCERGHSWRARIFSRTKEDGAGCPYCTGRKVLAGFNDLATLKPKLAQQWYQPLNGDLRPTDVTLGSNKRVWWQCSDGHVWQTYIYVRTKPRGTGCPVCAGVAKQRGSVVARYARSRRRIEETAAGMNV